MSPLIIAMMKTLSTIFLVTLSLSGCRSASQSLSNPQSDTNFDSKSRQTFVWAEKGLIFTLPQAWRRDDDSEDDEERSWAGPGNLKFSVRVHVYKPEYGNRSIENETNSFFDDHKRSEEEDLRYLEIDGVRGVHYLRNEERWDENHQPQSQKLIVWNAQRPFNGKRQIINVTLSTPSSDFTKDRATLYGLLQSIKFTRDG